MDGERIIDIWRGFDAGQKKAIRKFLTELVERKRNPMPDFKKMRFKEMTDEEKTVLYLLIGLVLRPDENYKIVREEVLK